MKKYNEILENALDGMIDEAAEIVAEKDEEILPDTDENILFSEEHEEKMNKFFKAERRKTVMKKLEKYSKRAACVVLVCIVAMGISIISDESNRKYVLNFLYDPDSPNTKYNFSDSEGTFYDDENFVLAYIPEGYSVTKTGVNRYSADVVFEGEGNSYFIVEAQDLGVDSMIDTENATIEKFMIDNSEAVLISNHNGNYVIWYDNLYSYSVIGNLSKEDTIKIAENMKFIGELKEK